MITGEMSTGIVVYLVLLASLYSSDGMRISQYVVTKYNDSEDTVSVHGLPQSFAAFDDTVTPRDANDLIDELDADASLDDGYELEKVEKGCSKGECTFCKKVKRVKICVIGKVVANGVSVSITVNGKQIAKKKETIRSHSPICVEKIPGIIGVSHICLTAVKVNLTQKSGCLKASFKMKVGRVRKTVKVNLGCFKIPFSDNVIDGSDVTEKEKDLIVDGENQSLQMLFTTSDVDNNGEMAVMSEDRGISTEHLVNPFKNLHDINLAEFLDGCHKGRCNLCKKVKRLEICVDAGVMSNGPGIDIKVTVNGHRLFHKEISVTNPPPICYNRIPGLKRIGNLCLRFYDINLKQKHACVKVSLKILKKKFSAKIGCFTIPFAELNTTYQWEGGADLVTNNEDVNGNQDATGAMSTAVGIVSADTVLRYETNSSG